MHSKIEHPAYAKFASDYQLSVKFCVLFPDKRLFYFEGLVVVTILLKKDVCIVVYKIAMKKLKSAIITNHTLSSALKTSDTNKPRN